MTNAAADAGRAPGPINQISRRLDGSAGRRHWVALTLISLASLFNYMDRMLLAVVSHPLKTEFGLTDTELGLLTGVAFALFYAMMGLPLGRLADRRSRKHVLAACLALWSVMTMATGWATSFLHLVAARILVAVGEAGCNPAAYSLLADNFEPRRRNLALGLFTAGSMLGVVAGFSLGGWISAQYGWRAVFLWLGAPGLLLAAAILFVMKEPVRGAFDKVETTPPPAFRAAMKLLLRNRAFVFLLIASGTNAVSFFGMSQWLPQFFIRSHGLTLGQVGWLFGTAFGFGMFLGTILGGIVGTRLGARSNGTPLFFCGALMIAIIPLYVAALLTPSITFAICCTFLAAMLFAAQTGPTSAATQNLVPVNVRATAASLALLSVALIGIGLGPLLAGAASDLLAKSYGDDGLRFALIGLQIFNLLAAAAFFETARSASR